MKQFAQRAIDVTIALGGGDFGQNPTDPVTLKGYRCELHMFQAATTSMGRIQLLVYGIPLSLINQLTQIGTVRGNLFNNAITIGAGDRNGTMATVFQGGINEAFGVFDSMPNVALSISATSMAYHAIKPVDALSFNGPTDAATILESLAKTMGVAFSNPQNISVMLQSPYFPGTSYDQFRACVNAANIHAVISNGVMKIWSKNEFIRDDPTLISPETGMVGYPSFSSNGIAVTTLFNPDVKIGHQIRVQSSLTPACGLWNVYAIAHSLSSEMPNGPWFTQVMCGRGDNGQQ